MKRRLEVLLAFGSGGGSGGENEQGQERQCIWQSFEIQLLFPEAAWDSERKQGVGRKSLTETQGPISNKQAKNRDHSGAQTLRGDVQNKRISLIPSGSRRV